MTVTEIADATGRSKGWVRAVIRDKKLLPATNLKSVPSSRYQVEKEDFLRFAEDELQLSGERLARMRERVEALPDYPLRRKRER